MDRYRVFSYLMFLGVLASPERSEAQCWSNEIAARNAQRFPELVQQRALLQNALRAAEAQASNRAVVTIPVVVHVVYKFSFENISAAQIKSQIDVLNADYRKMNADANQVPAVFQPVAADVEFEFCLATTDPNGNATTGITRRATSWTDVGILFAPDGRPRVNYTSLGGEDTWDPSRYLNIWVASMGGDLLGYGTFPGSSPAAEDGVLVDPHYFGTTGLAASSFPNHLGRTSTHEIGHYFNLYHIWGNGDNTCLDDDEVSDTPIQRDAYLGCPTNPQMSCGKQAMFMNYMDYTDDPCMFLFTQGQKTRMWAALNTARPGLLSSQVCNLSPTLPEASWEQVSLSPNPVGDKLKLSGLPPNAGIPAVEALDVLGRNWNLSVQMPDATSANVQVHHLPAGVYWIRVRIGNQLIVKDFVKI